MDQENKNRTDGEAENVSHIGRRAVLSVVPSYIGVVLGSGAIANATTAAPVDTSRNTGPNGGAPAAAAESTVVAEIPFDPLDFRLWTYDRLVPASAVAPVFGQLQATSGGGQGIKMFAQDSAVGSQATGGTWDIYLGYTDDPAVAAPARFSLWSALSPGAATTAKLIEAFYNPETAVSSIGIGEPTGAGTQLVIQGAGNSIVSHNRIGMYSLDDATHGQAYIQVHDVDPTGEFPAAFVASYDVFTGPGSPDDSGLQLVKNDHGSTGKSRYVDVQLNNLTTVVRRWALEEDTSTPSAQANIVFYDSDGTSTAAGQSYIKIPSGNSASLQNIVLQRDSTNTFDQQIISIQQNDLYFSDNSARNVRYESYDAAFFENTSAKPGTGWQFQNDTNGVIFAVRSYANKTVVFSDADNGRDGEILQLLACDTASASDQVLASIALQENALTQLRVSVLAWDKTANDWATFTLESGFLQVSGMIMGPASAACPVDTGHTEAAIGVNIRFVINGKNIDVHGVPWTTNATHWVTRVAMRVNAAAV